MRIGLSGMILALATTAFLDQESGLDRRITASFPIEVSGNLKTLVKSRLTTVSRVTRVSTGFEDALEPPPVFQATATMDLRQMTLRQALDTLVAADPRYAWREVSGIVIMRPKHAWQDCSHFLNREVSFQRTNVTIASAVPALVHLIDPTVPERPLPNQDFASATFSVDVARGSLLDVFNSVATAGHVSWVITYGAITSEGRWIELSLDGLDGHKMGSGAMLRPKNAVCH